MELRSTPRQGDAMGSHSQFFADDSFFVSTKLSHRATYINDIRQYGGEVARVESRARFFIADTSSPDCPLGAYSYQWIVDSVKKGCRQIPDKYRLDPVASKPTKRQSKAFRNQFTKEDDARLIQHLYLQRQHTKSDNELFKELAQKYPSHTVESWAARWKKSLRNNPPETLRAMAHLGPADGGNVQSSQRAPQHVEQKSPLRQKPLPAASAGQASTAQQRSLMPLEPVQPNVLPNSQDKASVPAQAAPTPKKATLPPPREVSPDLYDSPSYTLPRAASQSSAPAEAMASMGADDHRPDPEATGFVELPGDSDEEQQATSDEDDGDEEGWNPTNAFYKQLSRYCDVNGFSADCIDPYPIIGGREIGLHELLIACQGRQSGVGAESTDWAAAADDLALNADDSAVTEKLRRIANNKIIRDFVNHMDEQGGQDESDEEQGGEDAEQSGELEDAGPSQITHTYVESERPRIAGPFQIPDTFDEGKTGPAGLTSPSSNPEQLVGFSPPRPRGPPPTASKRPLHQSQASLGRKRRQLDPDAEIPSTPDEKLGVIRKSIEQDQEVDEQELNALAQEDGDGLPHVNEPLVPAQPKPQQKAERSSSVKRRLFKVNVEVKDSQEDSQDAFTKLKSTPKRRWTAGNALKAQETQVDVTPSQQLREEDPYTMPLSPDPAEPVQMPHSSPTRKEVVPRTQISAQTRTPSMSSKSPAKAMPSKSPAEAPALARDSSPRYVPPPDVPVRRTLPASFSKQNVPNKLPSPAAADVTDKEARGLPKYSRVEKRLQALWGEGVDYFPQKYWPRPNHPPEIHTLEALLTITKLARHQGISLPQLWQPGGWLFEAQAAKRLRPVGRHTLRELANRLSRELVGSTPSNDLSFKEKPETKELLHERDLDSGNGSQELSRERKAQSSVAPYRSPQTTTSPRRSRDATTVASHFHLPPPNPHEEPPDIEDPDLSFNPPSRVRPDDKGKWEFQDWINHYKTEFDSRIVNMALRATTMTVGHQAEVAMQSLKDGNGIPQSYEGIWSSLDDKRLQIVMAAEKQDGEPLYVPKDSKVHDKDKGTLDKRGKARKLKAKLLYKHGEQMLKLRMAYLGSLEGEDRSSA